MAKEPSSKQAEKSSKRLSHLEEQLEKQQKKKDEMRFLEELGKRISVAREGRTFFEKSKFPEALQKYRRFLMLTAKGFKTEVESLSPDMFDPKLKARESLLLSSAMLDLAKILDKLDTPEAKTERSLYLKLFIRFTVDQPYQAHTAQNLKRYLTYSKGIKNERDFWATYNAIKLKRYCVIAHAVLSESDTDTFESLWWLRDQVLMRSWVGRAFVDFYYQHGPLAARFLEKRKRPRDLARAVLKLFCNL